MNFQNKKILIVLFLGIIAVSYLLGDWLFEEKKISSSPFHSLSSSLTVPKALSVSPPNSFIELAKKVKPAVVNISTTKKVREQAYNPWATDPFFRDFFGAPRQQTPSRKAPHSLGTGFIINEKGDILTNNHVIAGADEIAVNLADGREVEAKIIGRDEKLDVAVIRPLKEGSYPFVPLGNSDSLEVGEWVVAVGNPFGLGHTVTAGIVSAKARDLGAGPYDDFIQTDASINPGNSGGPLFNTNGEVVGINTAIIASGQGIGFAIPINMAKDVVPQLITTGKVSRGWLGVAMRDLEKEEAVQYGLNQPQGAVVVEVVPGSPAEQAGLKEGDLILEFNGSLLTASHTLPSLVAKAQPGSSITLVFLREGKKYQRTVILSSTEQAEQIVAGASKGLMGMTLRDLSPAEANRLRIDGIIVTEVQPGGLAESVGIQEGDLILEVNGRPLQSIKELEAILAKIPSGKVVRLGLARGSQMYYFAFRKE